jgi:DNA polymerase-3 subunit alpha
VAKDSSLWVTQFDGKVIEDAGMLKMDFLGLKTLTVIGDAIKLIKKNYGIEIDPDEIPLDDPKTLELYQRGDTVGTFQFESDGMRKYLRDLKPTHIEDLIAMNALYRPGPMDYIDSFIRRKHGKELIEYPHELLEPILKASNGIMVYQEQIMQTAQIIAGYSLGGADLLRRAMGKKDKEKMAKERIKFVEGAGKIHGITEDKANEIFSIMEKFAEYGFNRSHSAAYSVVAFQTGYLKANYPGEYMSAVLNNHSTIEDISYFMDECQKMNIPVLGPDINESNREFTVNRKGEIRFGMGALKGVGEAAVDAMVEEREKNGPFTGIFDLVRRVNLRVVNKRSLESLVLGGALDSFANVHRAQYFHGDGNEIFLERAIKFGVAAQEAVNSAQVSLFGDTQEVSLPEPVIPAAPPWGNLDLLKKEKEVIGMYISGHPLDNYKFEMKNFCTGSISQVKLPEAIEKRKEFFVAGIISNVQLRTTKKGDPMATFHLEDFDDSLPITFFSKDYMQFKPFLQDNLFVAIKGKWDIKFKGSEELEFKITKMNLLSELKDTMAKELIVKMSLELLSGELVNRLFVEFNESQGSIPYRICVGSKTEQMIVDMQSKRKGIALTDRLIDFLVNEKAIQYDLALKG